MSLQAEKCEHSKEKFLFFLFLSHGKRSSQKECWTWRWTRHCRFLLFCIRLQNYKRFITFVSLICAISASQSDENGLDDSGRKVMEVVFQTDQTPV